MLFEIFTLSLRHFLNMVKYPDIQVVAVHALSIKYLDIKKSNFEAKNENILAGFISIHNRIYVS